MNSRYQAYPSYKDSGLDWLGALPEHWGVKRLGHFFNERREKVSDKDYPPLSVTMQGIVPQLANAAKTDAGDNRKLVLKNDFVINSRSDRKGSSGVSLLDGSVSLISIVMTPRKINPAFVNHLLRSYPFQEEFYRYGKGIVADLWSTNSSEMKNILLPDVPENEQEKIANFLDYETSKIDILKEKQQQLIKLLKEKRQAVISHAVTKGFNPDVSMRKSDTEWFDLMPSHWIILELKFSAAEGRKTFTDGDWIESPYITDKGVRLLQTGNVGIGEFKEKGYRYVSNDTFEKLNCTEVKPNDVLICRLDGPVGRSCLAPDLGVRVITSVDNAILKPNENFDPRYIVYLTNCSPWLEWIADLCRVGGGFRLRVSRTMLGDQIIPAPPIEEQVSIADQLDSLSNTSLECIKRCEDSIKLLNERRKALISAAVTGKIDVRNWQAPEPPINKTSEATA